MGEITTWISVVEEEILRALPGRAPREKNENKLSGTLQMAAHTVVKRAQ